MEKMKNSGIEWIGEIPEGWEVSKLKYEVLEPLKYGASESGIEFDERLPRYIRITDIDSDGNLKEDGKLSLTEKQAKDYIINDNTILFARSGGTVGKTFFYHSNNKKAAFAGYLISAVPNPQKMYPNWLYLYTKSNAYWDWANRVFTQATIQNIGADKYSELYIPIPSIDIQKRIADFLDAKCGKIDGLKNDIQKQIETLEQYKKSVITEAVTGKLKFAGINPNAKMKDSGIEWIGEIPEHWEIHPIYYYFEERKHKNSLCKEQNLLSLSYGNIIRKDINALGGLLPESFNTYNIIEKDDIVIRPTDLQNDKRSLRTGLCKEHGIITSAYITLIPKKKVNSKYFHYLLHSYDIEKVFYNMGNGVRQGLNYSEFAKLLVISPTKDEQKDIVAYLDEKCSSIDSIISTKKQQLEKLEEYKKSLIFEYVTGKKQVFSGEFPSETSGKKEV